MLYDSISIVLLSFFPFKFVCVPYLKEGANEAVTPAVISKFTWKQKPAGKLVLKKLKTVENPICCKLLARETNL